jgi:hypothetical protein
VLAGCLPGEYEPEMKQELVGDWDREVDNVVNGIWEFKATREVEEDLEKYLGGLNINKVRLAY